MSHLGRFEGAQDTPPPNRLKLQCARESSGDEAGSDSVGPGGARDSAFLTSSKVMSMLHFQGPHIERHEARRQRLISM